MFRSFSWPACLLACCSIAFAAALPNAMDTRDCSDNGPSARGCWKDGCSISDDMEFTWPGQGNLVKYNLDISEMEMAPDGVPVSMMVVNGQYPGPTIFADWGDTISVTVTNNLKNNGTGIHWHGIRQLGSNQMDGTNGLTECPIAPGTSKTYTFKATQYGTSWYHSHYTVQYGAGILGAIVIRGPTTANFDVDLGPLAFTDWFHTPIFELNALYKHASGPPTADNLLVNGSMVSSAGGKYTQVTLQPQKKHLLRLINTGINNWVHVSLDGHAFTVVAADMVPIKPYATDSISIAIGQRYDVIIEASQDVGNYWLRVGTGGGSCDGPNANAANIRAIFSYEGAPDGNPTSTGVDLPTGCYDESVTPYVPRVIPSNQPKEMDVGFEQTAANNNLVQWLVDNSSMRIDWDKPTLLFLQEGNTSFPTQDNVYTINNNNWVYFVIQQASTNPPLPHPIHLHGHDFWVLAQGTGTYSSVLPPLTLNNPIKRDTATLPAGGYLVIAFQTDNPGAWLAHCHVPGHTSGGFAVQFLERPNDILKTIGDLSGLDDGCRAWSAYGAPAQAFGDSGL